MAGTSLEKKALDDFLVTLGYDPKYVVKVIAEMGYISVDHVPSGKALVERDVHPIRDGR